MGKPSIKNLYERIDKDTTLLVELANLKLDEFFNTLKETTNLTHNGADPKVIDKQYIKLAKIAQELGPLSGQLKIDYPHLGKLFDALHEGMKS